MIKHVNILILGRIQVFCLGGGEGWGEVQLLHPLDANFDFHPGFHAVKTLGFYYSTCENVTHVTFLVFSYEISLSRNQTDQTPRYR